MSKVPLLKADSGHFTSLKPNSMINHATHSQHD